MLSTGEEIRSPQRRSTSGPILAKMPCTIKCGIGVLSEQNDIALEYNYMIISNVQIYYTIISYVQIYN